MFRKVFKVFPKDRVEQRVLWSRTLDIPVPGGGLHERDVRGERVFRIFPQIKKSATLPPHSGSALPPHSSPWTPAAYDVPVALEEEEEESEEELDDDVEYVEFDGRWWVYEWVPARHQYCWLAAADGSQIGLTIWRPPCLIGRGPG